jgi:hypothetical protein
LALRVGVVLQNLPLIAKPETAVVLACFLGGCHLRLAEQDAS